MERGHTADGVFRLRLVLCLLCLLFSSLAHRTVLDLPPMASEGEMGVPETSSMEPFVGRTELGRRENAAMAGNGSLLFVIGDSHGDKNYLVRSLLATGLFKLDQASKEPVVWSPGMYAKTNFEVVVLGDFIDRGTFSRQCTLLLKALSEEAMWGSHLVVLMGNHESMMLRHKMKYAPEAEGWSEDLRHEDLSATEGRQHDLIVWMRKRPVVYLSQGVLMTHGGLSKTVSASVLKQLEGDECQTAGDTCGAAAMGFINAKASEFYEKVHWCIQESRRRKARKCDEHVGGRPDVIGSEKDENLTVDWSSSGGGVLWFRGYSSVDSGAGTPASCDDVVAVGHQFGAQVMAVAHTTHVSITEYCHDQVPVFACDTHYTDCTKNGECDFDTNHKFHDGTIDPDAENVPQALKIEKSADGSRKFGRCLSRVTDSAEVFRSCHDVI